MTLSKEELRSIIESDHVQCGDAAAMARELLERRERDKQEPAPQIKNLEHFIAFWRKVQGGHILPSKNDIDHTVWFMEGLADIAAPPAPVVPDDFMDAEFRKFVLSKNYAVEDGGVLWGNLGFGAAVEAWQACRAAMLKQQSSIQACNSACSGAEIKQPASNGQSFGNSEQLNSPEIPDGWIKCSERLPDVGEPVLIRISCNEHFNIESARYKGDGLWVGCWFSTYGKNGSSYQVAHWMPLPAAPKQESE